MMGQSHFQRIFVDHARMVVLFIRAEFGSNDGGDALALCRHLSHKSANIFYHAKVVI
ncbi:MULTISPECIES: hypothetical protein [Bartonella]|uniref:hypothetical protein n=1 Tax=Bartonella TaxID=773 RepID=UPI00140B1B10|nr:MULTISPECIES: hypothetical protein [Bartonella]